MKYKFYQIESEDGQQWRIPIDVIVKNRAEYYAEIDNVSIEEATKDTEEYFDLDKYQIEDWARNNMNWDDVEFVAVKHREPDNEGYEDMWTNPKETEFIQ